MKRYVLYLLLALAACGRVAYNNVDVPPDSSVMATVDAPAMTVDAPIHHTPGAHPIILIGGQSNAEGRARCSDQTDPAGLVYCVALDTSLYNDEISDSPLDPFYWQLSRTGVALSPRVGDDFGIEMSEGHALHDAGIDADFAKAAVGSTTLAVHWDNPAYPSNPPTLPDLLIAQGQQMEQATGGEVVIIEWIQGEADAGYATYSAQYAPNEEKLFTKLKAAFPQSTIIFNQLATGAGGDYNSVVRAQQQIVADDMPDTVMFSSENLPLNSAHYTADGYVGLGLRYADAAKPILQAYLAAFRYANAAKPTRQAHLGAN